MSKSPLPNKNLLTFSQAMDMVLDGKKITKQDWSNDHYCLLKDGWLTIFRDGKFHQWLVSEADMVGIDWIIKEEN